MTTVLIDGDTLAYRAALGADKIVEDFDGNVVQRIADIDVATERAEQEVASIMSALAEWRPTGFKIALTDSANFRKAVLPTYKSKRGEKPMALNAVRRYLVDKHAAVIKPGLEGDDVLGIWATHPKLIPGRKIVASIDKDMKTVPGLLYQCDPTKAVLTVTEANADLYHMMQTLTGDTTDGYTGCPKVGPVTAARILEEAAQENTPPWEAVVAAYVRAGLTADDALVQARVARILRFADYNFKTKKPILWTPPA